MAKLINYFSLPLMLASTLPAKDLGCHGELFPIKEESLLKVIKRRLLNMQEIGTLEAYQKQLAEHAKKKALNPESLHHIHHTQLPRSFYYDPTITLSEDLKDHEGRLFGRQGDKANPLEIIPLTKELLFIDGEDELQVTWALSRTFPSKIILVKGQPLKLEERHHRPFYFDQLGLLTGRLGIKQVPARVFQEGTRLKIEELNINITRSSNHE
ncbi:MAG: type-F conjugative transfer system protein TraW [Caedibacter sp. 38-128]|nr:type-F conjugative transfer system protein TraW [Holosporales bacterium]OJX06106.1 MAG: type-F conjugative transfer system protein TraW [Caedibacter sp. 38-128]